MSPSQRTPSTGPVSRVGDDSNRSPRAAFERLADVDRITKFIEAIGDSVGPGDRVLDLDAGTGIFALAAARCGAEAVDSYETVPGLAAMARRNAAANGYASTIQVLEEDVTTCAFAGPYDVVIAEAHGVGLVDDVLPMALNNLVGQGVLSPEVRVIPSSQSTFIELVEADFHFYGFDMPMVQVEQAWQERRVRETMTELRLLAHPDFTASARERIALDEQILAMLEVRVMHSGSVNALRMTSMSHLVPGIESGWTRCSNAPVLVPVPGRELVVGTTVGIDLSYRMGGGFGSVRFDWSDEANDINPL